MGLGPLTTRRQPAASPPSSELRHERGEVVGDERRRRLGDRLAPGRRVRAVTPDSTSANGQPSASRARRRSTAGRRRRCPASRSARGPGRPSARFGLSRDFGVRARPRWPRRRRSRPDPGSGRPGPDRSRRGWWRRSGRRRARRPTRGRARRSRTRDGSRRRPRPPARESTGCSPAASSASTTPGPAQASTRRTRAPASTASSVAAATALVITSSDDAGTPDGGELGRDLAHGLARVVARRTPTRSPASRSCAMAVGRARDGSSPRQTTPSRSQQTTGRSARHSARGRARLR